MTTATSHQPKWPVRPAPQIGEVESAGERLPRLRHAGSAGAPNVGILLDPSGTRVEACRERGVRAADCKLGSSVAPGIAEIRGEGRRHRHEGQECQDDDGSNKTPRTFPRQHGANARRAGGASQAEDREARIRGPGSDRRTHCPKKFSLDTEGPGVRFYRCSKCSLIEVTESVTREAS